MKEEDAPRAAFAYKGTAVRVPAGRCAVLGSNASCTASHRLPAVCKDAAQRSTNGL